METSEEVFPEGVLREQGIFEELRQPRGHVGGRPLNEATNWSWIRQPLRHLPPLVLVGWLAGFFAWLSRSGCPERVDRPTWRRPNWQRPHAPEPLWEEAAWRPAEPARCSTDRFGRKKRAVALFFGIKGIPLQGDCPSRASSPQPAGQANPPWIASSSGPAR